MKEATSASAGGDLDTAIAKVKSALAEDPGIVEAHMLLGNFYRKAKRLDRAVEAYRAELETNAAAYRASFNLAKLLQKRGRAQEALSHFRATVEVEPQFGTGYLYLAKALLDAGDLAAAEEAARLGLARRPKPALAPLGHYILADVYNRLGRAADAAPEEAAGRRLERQGHPTDAHRTPQTSGEKRQAHRL